MACGLLVLGLVRCTTSPDGAHEAAVVPQAPVEVELRGCSWIEHGRTCELADDPSLVVALRPAPATLVVEVNGATIAVSRRDVGAWAALELRSLYTARRIVLRDRAGGRELAGWSITHRRESPRLAEARRLRAAGRIEEARGVAANLAASSTIGVERARALGLVARIDRGAGRTEATLAGLSESSRIFEETGSQTEWVRDTTLAAFTQIYSLWRLDLAAATLAKLPRDKLDPDGLVTLEYHQGVVAAELGDHRAALELFRSSRARAERGLDRRKTGDAVQMEAITLARLGRVVEADALFERVARGELDGGDPCRRAAALNNRAWLRTDVVDVGTRAELPPLDLARAFDEYFALKQGVCEDRGAKANALTDRALAYLEQGDTQGARRSLEEARRTLPHPDDRLFSWWLELEGRLAFEEKRPARALAAFEELRVWASSRVLLEARWRASFGSAKAFAALGRMKDASKRFDEADADLDAALAAAPLGEGRSSYIARFASAVSLHVDHLHRAGQVEAAAAVARRGRARMLSALRGTYRISELEPQRRAAWIEALSRYRALRTELETLAVEEWTLSERERKRVVARRAELTTSLERQMDVALATIAEPSVRFDARPPEEGELMLVLQPVPDAWLVIALGGSGSRAVRVARPAADASPEALGRAVLEPFASELRGAAVVTLFPGGGLEQLDVHAWPLEGRPLSDVVAVRYGIDLPRTEASKGRHAALVIGDPRSDLPIARQEAERVSVVLGRSGWSIEHLAQERASAAVVRSKLEGLDLTLLHYAGHAAFEGRDGWSSSLLLHEAPLAVGDILALARVPSRVVLSACESGKSESSAPVASLGLAQAFLAAGAEEVVASTRSIRETTGSLVGEEVSRAFVVDAVGLPEGLRRAQRLARERGLEDWSAFRVFSR